jgi:hypothetical protein
MNGPKHPRAVIGLILLAILCTVALGLQGRRSAPLTAYSPASPLGSAPGPPRDQVPLLAQRLQRAQPLWHAVQRIGTRAFWLQPWPWIAVGLVGFGLLAWGMRRMERD